MIWQVSHKAVSQPEEVGLAYLRRYCRTDPTLISIGGVSLNTTRAAPHWYDSCLENYLKYKKTMDIKKQKLTNFVLQDS